MTWLGFTRKITIGRGAHAHRLYDHIIEVAPRFAEAMRKDYGDAVVDLTPRNFGFPHFVAPRHTSLRVIDCPDCDGRRNAMTLCPTCGGQTVLAL